MEKKLQTIICAIESAFTKDDIQSAPRSVLENLILKVNAELTDLRDNLRSIPTPTEAQENIIFGDILPVDW